MTDLGRVEASSLRRSKLDITVVRTDGVAQLRVDGERVERGRVRERVRLPQYLVVVHAAADAAAEARVVGVELPLPHLRAQRRRLLENERDVRVAHDVAVAAP
uniref:Uncharacterized protein n=1 Tax=Oryza brachyantha TaxID=4533 RepID=J3MH74_ORYBR